MGTRQKRCSKEARKTARKVSRSTGRCEIPEDTTFICSPADGVEFIFTAKDVMMSRDMRDPTMVQPDPEIGRRYRRKCMARWAVLVLVQVVLIAAAVALTLVLC